MHARRSLATALSLLGLVGLTSVLGQKPKREPAPLDASTVSVRVLLGLNDQAISVWSGQVEIDKGEIVGLEGWRFHQTDEITGPNSWAARSRTIAKTAQQKKQAQAKKAAAKKAGANKAAAKKIQGAEAKGELPAAVANVVPNGVVVTVKAPDEASLKFHTEGGDFTVALTDLTGGAPRRYLDGKVEAQRVPSSVPLVDTADQDDYPAAASDDRGELWVAYVVHTPRGPATLPQIEERPKNFASFVPGGGGDQVRLVSFSNGKPGESLEVTGEGLDVWRPAVARAGDGSLTVAWSENRDGDFELVSRRYDTQAKTWSEPKRLTSAPGSDADVVLATAPDGQVWAAWQAWRDGRARILLAPIDKTFDPSVVSEGDANAWSPSIAIDKSGRIHVAYDAYRAGNYDVFLRTRNADGSLGEIQPVADSSLFEARPSVAVDGRGRVWIAYEERDAEWGKDFGTEAQEEGSNLYRSSAVRVRCVDGRNRFDAPDPVALASQPLRAMNSFPRLAVDRSGRPWLAFRHRFEPRNNAVGGVWTEHVTSLSDKEWSPPQVVPRSDGMLDNRPALVVPQDGPVYLVYSGDGRMSGDTDAINAGLNVAALVGPGESKDPVLAEVKSSEPTPVGSKVHPNEAEDVARLRGHRILVGGKTYQLLRGEFHRHTEFSGDGGGDGALEDMWRYALDAARFDWIGNGDHDNGGGKEYTWWITQKTTDLYHSRERFTPMFTYERSVQYPHGHRNVMYDRRGVRTLPRLRAAPGEGVANGVHLDDTKMLYDYLNSLGGICASHTSGTPQMGTDWRDNDPRAEPIVEIFQGIRNSYEHLGAPRVGRTPQEAVAGMQPYGMVWNALGLQYKLGFQSSSDHISTHISYAVAVAEEHTRTGVLNAFRRRHCYAATDNILLDVRSGDHLMGDAFDADAPISIKVLAHGTRPIKKVDIIKDYFYVYSTEPGKERVEFTWTDAEKRPPGESWYYVRVIQDDGEMAWASPFYVRYTRGNVGE